MWSKRKKIEPERNSWSKWNNWWSRKSFSLYITARPETRLHWWFALWPHLQIRQARSHCNTVSASEQRWRIPLHRVGVKQWTAIKIFVIHRWVNQCLSTTERNRSQAKLNSEIKVKLSCHHGVEIALQSSYLAAGNNLGNLC